MTPLRLLMEGSWSASIHSAHTNPVKVVEAVERLDLSQPRFVFAHMLTPHNPQRRTANCVPQAPTGGFGGLSTREQYAASVSCLNRLVIEAIDEILEADSEALIFVQGDHGPPHGIDLFDDDVAFDRDLREWSSNDIRQRLGVLSASRLPNNCATPASLHLVNTFRTIFDCLSKEGIEPIRPRSWIANYYDGDLLEVNPFP